MVPPDKTFFSRKPTKLFVQENVAEAIKLRDGDETSANKTIEGKKIDGKPPNPYAPYMRSCVQEAGDLIYVPHRWGHATFNLEPSIGIAEEFIYTPLAGWRAALF